MKKKNFILLCTLCTALLFSCNKEIETEIVDENPEGVVVPEGYTLMEFTAVCEETKTALDGSGNTVWSEGDTIKIICSDGTAVNAELTSEPGSTTGTFAGMVPSGKTALYAVYPASAYASVDGSTVNVTVPASQSGGSFGAGNIAVAKIDSKHHMAFKNVSALLVFDLPSNTNVTKVEVTSVDGTALVGTVPVDCSGSILTPSNPASTASTVSAAISGDGPYYISIVQPTTNHTKGLLLKYYSGDTETGAYYLNRNIQIVANNMYNFGELNTTRDYYVKPDGDGKHTGMDWDNAFSASEFKKKVTLAGTEAATATDNAKVAALKGATFHFSAEDFSFGDDYLIMNYSGKGATAFTLEGTIDGANRTVFKGRTNTSEERKAGVLYPQYNAQLTVKYIKFTGTNGRSNAAAIRINEGAPQVTFQNCVFDGNQTNGNGGAINIYKGTLAITDCSFTNNNGVNGAGIFVSPSADLNINVTRGVFKGNAGTYGGAIYVQSTNYTATVSLNTCTFGGSEDGEPNQAAIDGGALNLNKGNITITDCSFTNNTAGSTGGAIYTKTNCTINKSDGGTGSILTGNYANAGGAIYANTGTVNISDARFTGNHADGTGNNDAYAAGGAIYAKGSGLTLSCKGVLFEENYNYVADGPSVGGIIRVMESGIVAKFDDCTFDGNYTNRNTSTGEAPYAAVVQADIDGTKYYFNACEFKNNTSGTANSGIRYGGCNGTVIASLAESTIAMNNCSIHDNYGGRNKDDISWIGMDNANSTLILANTTIVGDNYRAPATGGERKNNWGVIKFNSTGNYYLLNSIICSLDDTTSDGNSKGNCFWVNDNIQIDGQKCTDNSHRFPVTCYYCKTSKEGDGRTNWGTDTGSGHDYYASSSCFSGWSAPYTWTGTLTGTNSGQFAQTADVNTAIQNADSDFYAWLNNIGALGKDIKGNSRGATSWPGCYQN